MRDGFNRRDTPAPTLSDECKIVPPPGSIERVPSSKPPAWVWMVLVVVCVVALMVLLYKSGIRNLASGGFMFGGVGLMSGFMLLRRGGFGGRRRSAAAVNDHRATTLRELDTLRDWVHDRAAAQAAEIAYHHPHPENELLTLVGSPRMWERRPGAPNFGHVRFGVGITRLGVGRDSILIPPAEVPPEECQEAVTAIAVRDFLLTQNVVHDVPRQLHLFDQRGWWFHAPPEQRPALQSTLRAMLCQLAVFHGPDDVTVAVVSDDLEAWEWCKWLPHTADPELVDASGPARLLFGDVAAFMARFGDQLNARPQWAARTIGSRDPDSWMVVVVDSPGAGCAPILGPSGRAGLSVIEATGDENSILAVRETAFALDDGGNLLKAPERN